MFDEGEVGWPETAPFHTPVFVLTHHAREPWVRPGGTTFYFVTDGFQSALEQARAAAGSLDVRISGGASVIQQAIKARAIDEITIHVAPTLMGRGVRLFDHLSTDDLTLEPIDAINSTAVTHLKYRVVK
jgi:dihydrofolate reductase